MRRCPLLMSYSGNWDEILTYERKWRCVKQGQKGKKA